MLAVSYLDCIAITDGNSRRLDRSRDSLRFSHLSVDGRRTNRAIRYRLLDPTDASIPDQLVIL